MYKQVIIIRTDTEMRKGKMCGQVAHAAVTAFWKSANHSQAQTRDIRMAERHSDESGLQSQFRGGA
jgi:peptidyl-tRNA hydrolase